MGMLSINHSPGSVAVWNSLDAFSTSSTRVSGFEVSTVYPCESFRNVEPADLERIRSSERSFCGMLGGKAHTVVFDQSQMKDFLRSEPENTASPSLGRLHGAQLQLSYQYNS